MKQLLAGIALGAMCTNPAVAQMPMRDSPSALQGLPPLTVTVLRSDTNFPPFVSLLLAVDNRTENHFATTVWSCVFYQGNTPVHEEEAAVRNVVPLGRTIKRATFKPDVSTDGVQCRLMQAR